MQTGVRLPIGCAGQHTSLKATKRTAEIRGGGKREKENVERQSLKRKKRGVNTKRLKLQKELVQLTKSLGEVFIRQAKPVIFLPHFPRSLANPTRKQSCTPSRTGCKRAPGLFHIYHRYPWPGTRFFRHAYRGSAGTRVLGQQNCLRAYKRACTQKSAEKNCMKGTVWMLWR